MHRRQFIQAAALAPFVVPSRVTARSEADPIGDALEFAAVTFVADAAGPLRHVSVRVSRWATPGDASRFGVSCLHGAGSDLPDGEFYQTRAVDLPVPERRLAPPAMARGWQTIVGVAAFTTDVVLLVVQRDHLVWDLRVGGAVEAPVFDVAVDLAAELVERDPEGPLVTLLPGPDDVPAGLGVVDSGTPVAMGDDPDGWAHPATPDFDG